MSTQSAAGGSDRGETERELRPWIELYQQLKVGHAAWADQRFADLVNACGIYQPPAAWTHGETQQLGQCFKSAGKSAEPTGWFYL